MRLHKSDLRSTHCKHKLLIVDDEHKICDLLAKHFTLKGFEVRTVYRGDEALPIAHQFQPDIVLLDLLMPGLDGMDTFKQLQQMGSPPRVLMVSAADQEETVKGALDLGVDFYICKPIDLTDLDQKVELACHAK